MTSMDVDLEHAYSPSRWSHRYTDPDKVIESHLQTMTQASDRARASLPCLLNWSIEPTSLLPDYAIDLYYPSKSVELLPDLNAIKPRAIFVYIHGGYWQYLSRRESSFMAQTMTDEQILTAVIGYPIAPQANIDQIVSCVEQGLLKILHLAVKLSVKVFIAGHSAGAHLAATALLVDWKRKYNIDANAFGGFFLVSGVFDLVPLVSTYVNEPIGMTATTARFQSPVHRPHQDYWGALKHLTILCVHGQYDPTAFREQNEKYGKYLKEMGFTGVTVMQMDDFDHFDVIEQLENCDQPLTSLILKLIKDSI